MSNCDLVSGVSSADGINLADVSDIVFAGADAWGVFQVKIAEAISDPNWANISWMPTKLAHFGGPVEIATNMIIADDGERLAAGLSAGTGVIVTAVGIGVAGITLGPSLALASGVSFIGALLWSAVGQAPVKDFYQAHIIDPLVTKTSDEIGTTFSSGGYSESYKITKSGEMIFENNQGIKITQSLNGSGNVVTTYDYKGVGFGFDEVGNSFVFDKGASYFEAVPLGDDFTPTMYNVMNGVLGDLKGDLDINIGNAEDFDGGYDRLESGMITQSDAGVSRAFDGRISVSSSIAGSKIQADGLYINEFPDGTFIVAIKDDSGNTITLKRETDGTYEFFDGSSSQFNSLDDLPTERRAAVLDFLNKAGDKAGDELRYLSEQHPGLLDELSGCLKAFLFPLIKANDPNDPRPTDPDYKDQVKAQAGAAVNRGSPLVLDMDGDGIELSAYADNNTSFFDLDQDGFAERTGWVNSDDGLLSIDLNNDGQINDNSELFGTMDTDGFSIAALYDSNADGILSEEDTVWGDLRIWRDLSQDGISDSGELFTLEFYGIVSIDLGATEVSQTNQGHDVTHISSYSYDIGSGIATRAIHDIWFNFDDVSTRYVQDYSLDIRTLFLSSQRGYGEIADLHIAMSIDNTGAGNLFDLVDSLNNKDFAQLFDSTEDTLEAVREIMYRWAGVDDVVDGSRGWAVDAKELAFIEKMMGEEFLQAGYNPNPGYEAAWNLGRAFNIAINNIYARIVGQAAGGELFEGNLYYNITADSIEGISGLNADAIGLLETEATTLTTTAQKETFWQNVVRVIEFNVGYDNLSSGDKALLGGAITSSDATLNVIDIITSLDVSENQYGQDDNDHLLGDSYTNDSLFGYAGNDRLEGMVGDDQLTGGIGNDYLLGGGGADIYHYASGDGFDTILEAGASIDEIRFGSGIDINDLSFTRVGDAGLIIDIDNGVHVGQIWLEKQFNGTAPVEIIRFSDNSTFDLMTLNHTTYGTSGNDTIWGVGNGGGGSDVIYGGAGDDKIMGYAPNLSDPDTNWLYGEDGNDTIKGGSTIDHIFGGNGNDILHGNAGEDFLWDGATGNDTLQGGTGSDEYHYTNGHDNYYDESGAADEIHLDAVWNGVTPVYYKQGIDLKIVFDASNDILIKNHFGSGHRVETLVFENAVSVDLSTVSYVLQGDDTNNSLTGTNNSDTFYGFGGNDTLTGNDGDDYLYGGTGNDTLNGGYGNNYLDGGAGNDTLNGGMNNDTYFYTSGHDVFVDGYGDDLIIMSGGWTVDDLTFRRYTTNLNDLIIEINGSNSIRLDNHFSSNDNFEMLQFADSSTIDLINKVYETHGTSGNDSIVNGIAAGGLNTDIFYGWAGNDTLSTGNGADIIYGGEGNDTLNGGDGDDSLFGEAGDDTVLGSTGNDYLDGGIGNDRLEGYSGNDTYLYLSGNDVVYDTGNTDVIKFASGWVSSDLTFRRDISDLRSLQILIDGTNSILIEDHFYGARSIETLEFNDLSTISMMDRVFETHGNDSNNTISGISVGGSLNDLIYGYGGVDTINGGDGNDTIYGGDGNDALTGADGNDILYGEAGDDTLTGNAGNDILIGGAGNDTTTDTNGGNDRHVYSAGLDTVIDSNGTDTLHVQGYTINDISIANLSTYHAKITINSGVDEITVNNLRNGATYRVEYIAFDDGFETDLPTYQTWATGTSGADTLTGTASDNTIIGKDGNDTLDGAGGNDDIHGGSGNDTLYGGSGSDLLHGGIGDDALYGQDGLDTLFGGAGADTFVFETATAFNNVDVIKDFSVAQNDVLDLSDLLGGYDPLTDAITDFVWITESAGNSNVFVDRDGLGGTYSLVAVAMLGGATGLTDEAALVMNGNLLVA